MNQDLRRRLIRPTILDPLLHRTVRLVVLHTGRGDCSPHKITHKMQKLKRRPLQTGLAPRRTHKISVPAMVQSKQRRPDRRLQGRCFSCSSSSVLPRVASHRGASQVPPGQPEHTNVFGGSTAWWGTAQRRTTGSSGAATSASRRRQPWPACSPCLSDTAPPPCHQDEPSLGHCTSPKRQVWGANTRLCQQRVWR